MNRNTSGLLCAIFILTLSSPVFAQSAKDEEEASYYLCEQMTGSANEEEACTDWIEASVNVATYRARFSQVAKFLSSENIQRYQTNAEKRLNAKKAEPMTACELNFDILSTLTDSSERDKRVLRLIEWANRLAPQQYIMAAHPISMLDDFSHLSELSAVRKFIEKTRDEISEDELSPSAEVIDFLSRIEKTNETMMTPKGHAILLIHEIDNGLYQSAHARLLQFDIDKCPQKLRNQLVQKVLSSAKKVFGEVNFSDAVCFPEFHQKSQDSKEAILLKKLAKTQPNMTVSAHITANMLRNCDNETASASVFEAFNADPLQADSSMILDKFITFVESQKSDLLTTSVILQAGKLSSQAMDIFKKKYAAKLKAMGLEVGRRSLERQDANQAAAILDVLRKMNDRPYEIMLEYGRALQMQKKSIEARQIWGEIIQNDGKSSLAEKAYYLSVQSFKRDKKTSDAESLKAQYEDNFPAGDASNW